MAAGAAEFDLADALVYELSENASYATQQLATAIVSAALPEDRLCLVTLGQALQESSHVRRRDAQKTAGGLAASPSVARPFGFSGSVALPARGNAELFDSSTLEEGT